MDPNYTNAPAYGAPQTGEPIAATATVDGIPYETRERALSAANWFFWIAALSLVNSMASHFGSSWGFIIGLGITQLADAILANFDGAGTAIALVFDLLAASLFAGIGLLARRFVLWPFVVGMVLYTLDGLLFVLVGDILSIAFHAFALFSIFVGFNALRQARNVAVA